MPPPPRRRVFPFETPKRDQCVLSITIDLIEPDELGEEEPVRVARIIVDDPFADARVRIHADHFEVESKQHPGTWHRINRRSGACDCKGYIYNGHCRHRRLLERRGLIRPPDESRIPSGTDTHGQN